MVGRGNLPTEVCKNVPPHYPEAQNMKPKVVQMVQKYRAREQKNFNQKYTEWEQIKIISV